MYWKSIFRMEMEKFWEVRAEELEHLRRKEVLGTFAWHFSAFYAFLEVIFPVFAGNMEEVLLHNAAMKQLFDNAVADRDLAAKRTQDQ